jgi:flavin reductase (DIM6/NTAB) family NADH-FMN oxidoreductase RutF
MIYEPGKTAHGLPHDPFKSCVIPRPIGWISTLSKTGVPNLAPFSQFQNLGFKPPYVMFSANEGEGAVIGRKDSVTNVETTGEFVWNMATYALREAVNITAQDVAEDVDEFELAGLTKAPSKTVKPWRVKESPVHFECKYYTTLRLPGAGADGSGAANLVIARVVLIHIEDWALTADGYLDVLKLRPIARLGYKDYTSIESVFSMVIPGAKPNLMRGLEGQTSGAETALVE